MKHKILNFLTNSALGPLGCPSRNNSPPPIPPATTRMKEKLERFHFKISVIEIFLELVLPGVCTVRDFLFTEIVFYGVNNF